jgi:hydrogenase/urease accessory protein HupE
MTGSVKKLLALALVAAPTTALAHPGHGTTEPTSAAHYLVEPAHLAAFAAVSVVIGLGFALLRSRRARRDAERQTSPVIVRGAPRLN